MKPFPPETSSHDPLKRLLADTETELRRRLEDACEADARGVSTKSSEEIRQDGVDYYLFDVAADPGERHDLTASHPDLVHKLSAMISAWEKDVDATNPLKSTAGASR